MVEFVVFIGYVSDVYVTSIQDVDIIATYSDTFGAVRISRVKMRDLSSSWVLKNPSAGNHEQPNSVQVILEVPTLCYKNFRNYENHLNIKQRM